jgi:hypothetical protein
VFSKVDCTTQSSLCSDINGYPLIKIHVKQEDAWTRRDYDSEKTIDALEALCKRLAAPKFKAIQSATALEKETVAFAVDSRASTEELSSFHLAANEFFHVCLTSRILRFQTI